MFSVQLTKSAHRDLTRLSKRSQARIIEALNRLAADPHTRRPGLDVRRMVGDHGGYRLRVGPFRILFSIEGEDVIVTAVGRRGQLYLL